MSRVRLYSILALAVLLSLGGVFYFARPVPRTGRTPETVKPPVPAPAPSDIPSPAPVARPAAAPAPVEDAMLTGLVLDSDARPVAKAKVTLADPASQRDIRTKGNPIPKSYQAFTNEDGEFRFVRVTSGPKYLIARHPDHPPGWSDPFVLKGTEHKVIRLRPPLSLSGVVAPPNATVTVVYRLPGLLEPPMGTASVPATVGPGGAYRITNLPATHSLRVKVEAVGFKTKAFGPYELEPGEHRLDFALETGLALLGRVRTAAGEPVTGASVKLGAVTTQTDDQGRFTVGGLDDYKQTLVISREAYLPILRHDVGPGTLELTLVRGATVKGRVTDAAPGLFICYSAGATRYRIQLRDSGAFSLDSVPPGPLRLEVEDGSRQRLGMVDIDAPEGGKIDDLIVKLR